MWVTENLENGKFFLYDPNTNKIELKIGNKSTLESISNQWIVVNDFNNVKRTYRTDENGNAIIGKYATEDGNVYYLSDQAGENYGSLVTGWIIDPVTHHWYYSSPQTGSLLTGWNTIDGYDYYFIKPDDIANNNLTANDVYTKQIYGMMLSDVETIDGFTIDSLGRRVQDKPYLFNQ